MKFLIYCVIEDSIGEGLEVLEVFTHLKDAKKFAKKREKESGRSFNYHVSLGIGERIDSRGINEER